MLHACVERFDVTGIAEKFLGTKRGIKLQCEASLPPVAGPTI